MANSSGTTAIGAPPIREYIAPVLSLVVGVLVLLPTAIGPVNRPFALGLLLPSFVVLALISMIALAVALLASSWTATWATSLVHKAHGIGNYSGVLSLVAAAVFLWSNYLQDISASPRIINVKVNPVQPEVGKVVEVELDVSNRTGGPLAFHWEFDGKKVAGMRTAYLKMPEKPGTFLVTASVGAGTRSLSPIEAGASTVSDSRELLVGISTVRVWLEVSAVGSQPDVRSGVAAPQDIIQTCKEDKQHDRRQKGASNSQRAPRATGSATTGHR